MKKLLVAIIALIFIAAGVVYWRMHPRAQGTMVPMQRVTYEAGGLSFSYPSHYTRTEQSDSFHGSSVHVLTFIEASTTIPDMSEGPTTISIIEVSTTTTSLAAWLKESSISNFYLSPDKTFASTTVGGAPALAYRYSGLYENDAVAAEHNGKIYIFAASWTAATQPIRGDFKDVLSSVEFK